jgi:hypothetical protein
MIPSRNLVWKPCRRLLRIPVIWSRVWLSLVISWLEIVMEPGGVEEVARFEMLEQDSGGW